MTKVINLFGGPGVGKSTLSAEIYCKMKQSQDKVELVREYVKDWAWQNRKIENYDQLYITAKQCRAEYTKYGKVDYIVTDSPVLLSPFYCEYYSGNQIVMGTVQSFMELAQKNGVEYHNFLLKRFKPYDPNGRYENEEQAKAIDVAMQAFLDKNGVPYTVVDVADEVKSSFVLDKMGLYFRRG